MRTLPSALAAKLAARAPFVGDDRTNAIVTVQPDWYLNSTSAVTTSDSTRLPYRWFQNLANDQVELTIPGLKSIEWDRTLDADAASATIVFYNQTHADADVPGQLGNPGYLSWAHGEPGAATEWGQSQNSWHNILIPNALLRTYEGIGGYGKTRAQAIADGNIVLTGLWLIDDVNVGTDGMLTLTCRDMAKLLIEQRIYPPLMPNGWYPLHWYRWAYTENTNPAIPVYSYTHPVEPGPGPEGNKYITDVSMSADGKGYWLVGTDGGVFSFGVPFYGSRGAGGQVDDGPMMGIAADPLNRGYWLVTSGGGVFTFGEVPFHGSALGSTISIVTAIAAHPSGDGYWLVTESGTVFAYGTAVNYGGNPAGASNIVDMAPTPSGLGYWLLDFAGHVYSYGDAGYQGNGTPGIDPFVGIAPTSDGGGYWLAHQSGVVDARGNAENFRANGDWVLDEVPPGTLNDPIFGITSTPSDKGYILVGGDGGVFTFGDAPFYGSLPAGFTYETKADGDYTDFAQILKALLLWSGWLAYGDGGDNVYGVVETTGAWSEEALPMEMFDKKPVIDAIKELREAIGYLFYVGEEGEAHFISPNWFTYGNLIENGSRVTTLPIVHERTNLTNYSARYGDASVRSEITISSSDPSAGLQDTVTTRVDTSTVPAMAALVRGMVRPAIWTNQALSKATEQARMLERILDFIVFSLRKGTVECLADPRIQINDQVRIFERVSAETYCHYVRGIHSKHDLDAGEWTYQLQTVWLGASWGL